MNQVPEDKPGNPLQSRENGDIYCNVCDVTMNSGAQAQGHIMGVKHKSRMDRAMRSFRGRGRGGFGRGGWGGRGGYSGGPGPRMWGPPPDMDPPQIDQEEANCDEDEANEEYERVLSEALADNVDVEEAKMRAEAAKQAALGAFAALGYDQEPEEEMDETEYANQYEDNGTFPPPGIDILQMPEGDNTGQYRCLVCGVMLLNENNLTNHLSQLSHQMNIEDKRKERRQEIEARKAGRGRGKGKIYRGRCNAKQEGSMKAQRGRRGLISYGETMPEKLSKSQKKAQPKDIAALLALKSSEAGVNPGGDMKKVAPYLMSFVRGGIIDGDMKVTSAAMKDD